ncbi:hypothetical protein YPPY66_3891, partial [Yersinia pestis PY-66]
MTLPFKYVKNYFADVILSQ